ncbi:hypothetical protein AB0I60_02515 [Actinosynnema sp. NPDC050436]|uniref:hypothetical protein n=1 Tax=Actinosynnema sp. NPDC050436 TaxID=3155659 RepID=UPI003411687B
MQIWTERPAVGDVEEVVRRYFALFRAGNVAEAGRLVEHASVPHVLKALWAGSVGAGVDGEVGDDLSWLRELDLGAFAWGPTGSHCYVELTWGGRVIEVSLGFWVKPVDGGWVVAGPSTLW